MTERAPLRAIFVALLLSAPMVARADFDASVISWISSYTLVSSSDYTCPSNLNGHDENVVDIDRTWSRTYEINVKYSCADSSKPQNVTYSTPQGTGEGFGQCGWFRNEYNQSYQSQHSITCAPTFGTPTNTDTGSYPTVRHQWTQHIEHNVVDHKNHPEGQSNPAWVGDDGCTDPGGTDFRIYSDARYADDAACSSSEQCSSTPQNTIDECQLGESTWWDWEQCSCITSPIFIDLDGDGLKLTSAQSGVPFDLTANGQAQRVSWTNPRSRDALLVLDRNANGLIDNGTELFGGVTPQPAAVGPDFKKNGFRALAEFDKAQSGGNGDGKLTHRDRIYNDLRLWFDLNHDGISTRQELFPLSRFGLTEISLTFSVSDQRDAFGNLLRYQGQVVAAGDPDISRRSVIRAAIDVFLQHVK